MKKILSIGSSLTSKFSTNSTLYKGLSLLGLYYTIKGTCHCLSWLKKNFLTCPLDLKSTYGDDWVIITGASDGIGLAFAKEIASRNMKLCLIARNKDKLSQIKDELVSLYPQCQIKYFDYDFNRKYNKEDIEELRLKLKELNGEISILINNVGVMSRDFLSEMKEDDILAMINVNVVSMTIMSKIVIESMAKKKRSLIVGSGSVAGSTRLPQRQIYAASKSYMESFMECLGKEYPNIDTTYLEIGPVASNMNPFSMPFKLSSEAFAQHAMKRIGRYDFTTGHIKHELYNIALGNPLLRLYYFKNINQIPKPKKDNEDEDMKETKSIN